MGLRDPTPCLVLAMPQNENPTLRAGDAPKSVLDQIKGAEGHGLGKPGGQLFVFEGSFSMVVQGSFLLIRGGVAWGRGLLIRSWGYVP